MTDEAGMQSPSVFELLAIYALVLILIKVVLGTQQAAGISSDILVLVPFIFVYVPVLWARLRRLPAPDIDITRQSWKDALHINLLVAGCLVLPFLLANHLYQAVFFDRHLTGKFPSSFWSDVVPYHLIFVAFPEEFFYRGYLQTHLTKRYPSTWSIFGTPIGFGVIFTALLFTLGHSVIVFRWWHFAIVFPALIFGWLRERTHNILASTLFHAGCNILMVVLDTTYGVIPP